jgi:hypothetical protein
MGLHALLQRQLYLYLFTQRMMDQAVKLLAYIREVPGSNLGLDIKYPHNYWVFGLCPSSGILQTRKHSVL